MFDFRRLWQLAPACAYALYLRFCDSILIKSFFSYRVFAAPEAAAGVECGCLVRRFFVQLREEILGSGDLLPRRLRSRSCMHEGGKPALVRCRCFLCGYAYACAFAYAYAYAYAFAFVRRFLLLFLSSFIQWIKVFCRDSVRHCLTWAAADGDDGSGDGNDAAVWKPPISMYIVSGSGHSSVVWTTIRRFDDDSAAPI